jgi:hypothetical protein
MIADTTSRQADTLEAEVFGRRLSDKVLVAFHQACAQHDVNVACGLMAVLEHMWLRDLDAPWGRRRNVNWLLPARERLLHEIALAEAGRQLAPDQAAPTARRFPSGLG